MTPETDASMRIRLLSLVQVVHVGGSPVWQGETVTALNDMCLFAPGNPPRPVDLLARPRRAERRSDPRQLPAHRRTLRVLGLTGNAYDRGVEHGTRLRAEIATLIGLWEEDLRKSTGADPDAFIKQFLAETNSTPAIRKWTPDLLEEVRRIADGAGQPFDTIFAFQLVRIEFRTR